MVGDQLFGQRRDDEMAGREIVGEVGGAGVGDEAAEHVAHRITEAAAHEERVERGPAAMFEQGEDLVARRFGQFGNAVGEEQHMALHDRVEQHAGGDALGLDHHGSIGGAAGGGLGFADAG